MICHSFFRSICNVIILLGLFTGCSSPAGKNTKDFVASNPGLVTINVLPLESKIYEPSEILGDIELVELGFNKDKEGYIGNVDKLIIDGNKMFFLDRFTKSISCFDRSGKFLYVINNNGKGSEEYVDLETFYINEEERELVIIDRILKSKLSFNIDDGKFIRKEEIGFYVEEALMSENKLILTSDEEGKSKLMVYDNDLKGALYSCFPYQKGKGDFVGPNILSKFKNKVIFSHLFDDIIYEVGPAHLIPLIKVDFGTFKVSKNFLEGSFNDFHKKLNEFTVSKYASLIHELHETKDFISFRYPHGEDVYQVFFSKKNKSFYNIKALKDIGGSLDFSFPIASSETKFASIIYPGTVKSNDFKNSSLPYNIKMHLSNLTEDDNACILFYSIEGYKFN